MSDTILIVEKNTSELRKLREILTREGFGVLTATDAQTGKQICDQISIKYIIAEPLIFGYPKK